MLPGAAAPRTQEKENTMMKRTRRILALALALLTLLSAFPALAASSDAYGTEMEQKEVTLNQGTSYHSGTFWSDYYKDRRQENYFVYSPNGQVTPKVTYGGSVTAKQTVSSAAASLEQQGYRVVAGINGDFFDSNGVPTGILISGGRLLSSDGGNYGVGFTSAGSAVIGLPQLTMKVDVSPVATAVTSSVTQYSPAPQETESAPAQEEDAVPGEGVSPEEDPAPADNGTALDGTAAGEADAESAAQLSVVSSQPGEAPVVRQPFQFTLSGFNKARGDSGIYAYTYSFKAAHDTGTVAAGVDVVLTPIGGDSSVTEPRLNTAKQYQVVSVRESTGGALSIAANQLVLSANAAGTSYADLLRSLQAGDTITLTVSSSDSRWNQVTEAVGGLYPLLKNGQIQSGLDKTNNPRTAIGVTANGQVVFYTVDGRREGYSVGSSQSVLAQRMAELGCVDAICLDGGGSTTAVATMPDSTSASQVNRSSDSSQRSVTDHIFLVATASAGAGIRSVYLDADSRHVLAGSTLALRTAAVDSNYIPTSQSVSLTASAGSLDGTTFQAPDQGGTVTITASAGGIRTTMTVTVVDSPDSLEIYRNSSKITSLTLEAGEKADLSGKAVYNHMVLASSDDDFTWSVTGNVGTIDENGLFTAGNTPGTGTIVLTKGSRTVSIPVTISSFPLETLEDFEGGLGAFTGYNVTTFAASGAYVRFGRQALGVSYSNAEGDAAISLGFSLPAGYNRLTFWVYGDNSGASLSLYDNTGVTTPLTTLNFSGWKQVSVTLPETCGAVSAVIISGGSKGTFYLDQFIASYGDVIDNTAPVITGSLSGATLSATATDAVDGALEKSSLTLTCDGKSAAFSVSASGAVSADLSAYLGSGTGHRITLTAVDASGNRSSKSWDVAAASGTGTPFVDLPNGHWSKTYVEYLYAHNILTGSSSGGKWYVRPDSNMTRSEFAVMLMRWLGLDPDDYADVQLPFADADTIESWALNAAKAMYDLGIMEGTNNGGGLIFDPKGSVTRAQALTMLGRIQPRGYARADLSAFPDGSSVPSWAASYMETLFAQGILTGSDGKLLPNAYMTRAQAAKVLYLMW